MGGGGSLWSKVAVRVLDIRSKGPLFQSHWRHGAVSLSKTFYLLLNCLLVVNIGRQENRPNKTEKC